MDVFNIGNKIPIHEAGHAVVGWIMKIHFDNTFDSLDSIFYYYYPKDDKIVASCIFNPGRATNIDGRRYPTRHFNQAITDLAINIAGTSTYAAYIHDDGDPEYPIKQMPKLFDKSDENDFRFFSDIARYDLKIRDNEVVEFAETFHKAKVDILRIPDIKHCVELITIELVEIFGTSKVSLCRYDITRLESIILPLLSANEIAEAVEVFCDRIKSIMDQNL